jgi:hypothetical protein
VVAAEVAAEVVEALAEEAEAVGEAVVAVEEEAEVEEGVEEEEEGEQWLPKVTKKSNQRGKEQERECISPCPQLFLSTRP